MIEPRPTGSTPPLGQLKLSGICRLHQMVEHLAVESPDLKGADEENELQRQGAGGEGFEVEVHTTGNWGLQRPQPRSRSPVLGTLESCDGPKGLKRTSLELGIGNVHTRFQAHSLADARRSF